MWRHLLRAGICLGLVGCQALPPNTPQDRGSLKITVKFPQKEFSTQLIRPETKVIYVLTYRGDLSLEQPQVYGPITPQNAQVRLHQLLSGEQKVLAAAYDDQNRILTAGRSLAQIRANSLNQASLELGENYTARLAPTELAFLNGLRVKLPAPSEALSTDLQPQAVGNQGQGVSRGTLADASAQAAVNYQAEAAPQTERNAAGHKAIGGSSGGSRRGIDPAVALPEPAAPSVAPGQVGQPGQVLAPSTVPATADNATAKAEKSDKAPKADKPKDEHDKDDKPDDKKTSGKKDDDKKDDKSGSGKSGSGKSGSGKSGGRH